MKKVLALVLAAVMLIAAVPFAMAEEEVTLNVWSFTNEFQGMIEKYFAPSHPNIKFNFTLYPTDGGEYTSHVDTLFAADATAEDAPDIFTLEAAFVKKYVNSDWTADLKDLGFTDEDFATCIPAMLQIGANPDGVQKGLAWQSTPGALMYRADLAEKYLGVTTPEEFQEKVAAWDAFLETAEELKEASDGACKMFCATGDIWNAYQYNRSQGWVVDGKLVIDDVLYDFLDLCKTAEEEDLYAKGMAWQETWFAGMNGTNEIMCYLLPTWGLHYTLKPNCVAGWDAENPDSEENIKNATENGTYGDWRLVDGPVAYSWGGTWMAINAAKAAQADDAKKAAMHDLIYFFSLNEDWLVQYAADSGDFVGSAKAVETILANGGTPNPFLGGQDHYAIFASAAALANGSLMSQYDSTINSLWSDYVTSPYTRGEKDLDTCIAEFKAAVAAAITTITVE